MTITPEEIPDKLYFRIGEVARLAAIKPYVLRFWETEFHVLDPKKSGTGHRLYRRKDVQLVFEIKQLLYEKRYTIDSNVFLREGASQTKQTAKSAGLGALIGAGIGAVTGGKKGAAIGAGVGAGGGVAVEAASKNEQARIESETRIDFRLEAPLEVILK